MRKMRRERKREYIYIIVYLKKVLTCVKGEGRDDGMCKGEEEKRRERKRREEKKEEEVNLNLTSFAGIFPFGNFCKSDHHCGK